MRALPALERLHVQGCIRINDEAVKALAAMPGLKEVDLQGTGVTEKGAAVLKAAKPIDCYVLRAVDREVRELPE